MRKALNCDQHYLTEAQDPSAKLAGTASPTTRHDVPVAELAALFAGYTGGFVPTEDDFASPIGREAL